MNQDYLKDSQLKAIMPLCNAEKRKIFLPYINLSMAYFKINTELRISMYLAHLAHESTDLTRWVENLNYSAKRLTEVWRKRFPTIAAAKPFANNPQALANKTYNGRMGNRKGSNDGWDYRGRAPLQATGREMYEKLTAAIGRDFNVDFLENPDLLLQVQYGFMASAWIFAVEKKCLPLADARDLEGSTRRINGGLNGLADRLQNYRKALEVLPDSFKLKTYETFSKEFFALDDVVANAAKSDNQSRLSVTFQDAAIPEGFDDEEDSAAAPAINLPEDSPSDAGDAPAFDSPAADIPIAVNSNHNEPSPDNPQQVAENITNVSTGEKSGVPDNFKPENKTVNAPSPSGMMTKATTWLAGLGLGLPSIAGIVEALKNYGADGVWNLREIVQVSAQVAKFVLPYAIYIGIAFIVFWGIKEILKQVSLIVKIYVAGRGDMNNVEVAPTAPVAGGWRFAPLPVKNAPLSVTDCEE